MRRLALVIILIATSSIAADEVEGA